MLSIHFDIPVKEVLIRQEYLFDFKDGFDCYLPAKIIAISSYPGHIPTFTAIINNEALFHYLPINAFVTIMPDENKFNSGYEISKANYFNCPSEVLSVSIMSSIKNVSVFNRDKTLMGKGKYLMTFDWYNDNDLCHMVALDDGNLVLTPSHKIIIGSSKQLPNYKKLHSTWKLPLKDK